MKGSDFCDRAALGSARDRWTRTTQPLVLRPSLPLLPSVISASSFTSNLIPRYEYQTPLARCH